MTSMSPASVSRSTSKDVDDHYERAKAAGAEIVQPPADTDYGARLYSVRDIEGNLWSFGNYRPAT